MNLEFVGRENSRRMQIMNVIELNSSQDLLLKVQQGGLELNFLSECVRTSSSTSDGFRFSAN